MIKILDGHLKHTIQLRLVIEQLHVQCSVNEKGHMNNNNINNNKYINDNK